MTTLSSSPAADWLQLWQLVQQSHRSISQLLFVFSSPAEALKADASLWRGAGVAPAHAQRLALWQQGKDPELDRAVNEDILKTLAWCEQPDHGLIVVDHDDYPILLRETADPPPLLFWRGNASLLDLPQIAIVGTRHPSLTGKNDAAAFAEALARQGLVITSGLARGIDAAAHAGALKANANTIAVLGAGADVVYPKENRQLFERIAQEGGLLLSEYRPGTPPLAAHFPRRNRIISGLSSGTLVVEAAPESGSLITARLAAEQGRMVWALPGSRHHVQAQGCLQLIREGATLVTDTTQIVADLPPMTNWLREQCQPSQEMVTEVLPALSTTAQQLLEALGCDCRHADWLIQTTGQPPAKVLRELMMLEVSGLIAAVPGGYERIQQYSA